MEIHHLTVNFPITTKQNVSFFIFIQIFLGGARSSLTEQLQNWTFSEKKKLQGTV